LPNLSLLSEICLLA